MWVCLPLASDQTRTVRPVLPETSVFPRSLIESPNAPFMSETSLTHLQRRALFWLELLSPSWLWSAVSSYRRASEGGFSSSTLPTAPPLPGRSEARSWDIETLAGKRKMGSVDEEGLSNEDENNVRRHGRETVSFPDR
jgi:hypothetical protein